MFKFKQKLPAHNIGALFGLDARIAIAIFAAITITVAAIAAGNISRIYAQALADELKQISEAVEGFHADLRKDVYRTLIEPNEKNAFVALYDPSAIRSNRDRGKWLGPYLKDHTTTHSRYGEMRLNKRAETIAQPCTGSICYFWLSLEKVPQDVVYHLNDIFDPGEAEMEAQFNGRVQWETFTEETGMMWFRLTQAIK